MKNILLILIFAIITILFAGEIQARPGGGNSYNSSSNDSHSSSYNNHEMPEGESEWSGFTKGLIAILLIISSVVFNAITFSEDYKKAKIKTIITLAIILSAGIIMPLTNISWIWFAIYYGLNGLVTYGLLTKKS